jgi:hypothetical protein
VRELPNKKLTSGPGERLFKIDQTADFSEARSESGLVAQNDTQQRAVDLKVAVVIDEAQFPEFVHEETDTRPGRADHLGERLLADLGRDRLRPAFLGEIREEKKRPRQALFAGVEQLIDQVLFD